MITSPLLSIVTPTYNRGHLLRNCYESLLKQTDLDFEWIIVDDGSTDDTASVAADFQTDLFPICYVQKENGGKHTALNTSMEYLRGEYVLILDSDDTLTPNAVETVRHQWTKYSEIRNIAILTFLKGSNVSAPNCTGPIANQPVDILRYKRNIIRSTDCCEVIRTGIFKRFPFPVFEGERFLPECALWNRVAVEYQCVYINEVIYICEYLEGGLTQSGRSLRIRNPKGGMYICQLRMVPKNFLFQRFKYSLLYCTYGFFAGFSPAAILSNTTYKTLTTLCLLPGWMLYIYWGSKYK